MEGANSSFRSFIELLLFQIIVIQKEPDHPSFLIDIKSKGTFSSKKEPIGKVWYIAHAPSRNHNHHLKDHSHHLNHYTGSVPGSWHAPSRNFDWNPRHDLLQA